MKKIVLFIFFVLLVSSSIFIFLRNQKKSSPGDFFIYNIPNERWELSEKKPAISREEWIASNKDNSNEDGLHNYSVLRGYFDHYDSKTNTIYLKTRLPFGDVYDFIAVNTSQNQGLFCAKKTITDQKTGRNIDIRQVVFPVKNGETLRTNLEQPISFDQLVEKANQETYLLLQLTKNYSSTEINYLYKLVAAGLCE